MKRRALLAFLACWLPLPVAAEIDWENPVFDNVEDAVDAAGAALADPRPDELRARELFTLFTLSSEERPRDSQFEGVRRRQAGSFLVTFPSYLEDPRAGRTLESFLGDLEDEKDRLVGTLRRFGYPRLPGLTYLKLVENVEELQDAGLPASERRVQTQGLTYFCRYVVIPLSYVTPQSLAELESRQALDPSINVQGTLRMWQKASSRLMRSTFRHELVHVWTNSSLGPPRYRDRERYPRWFLEGSASFLAADTHAALSERYQDYQNRFFYLLERHGVAALDEFFRGLLAGASAREGLQETYGITDGGELRARAQRWHGTKDAVRALLTIALLLVVVVAFVSSRIPVFGSLQLWAAAVLAYGTFSGFCASTQALNGATAVVVQQAVMAAAAAFFAFKGFRSLRRVSRSR